METTTYYGKLLDNQVFDTKVDPTLWNTLDELLTCQELEPYIQITDINMHFYPEKLQCIKTGKVFSVSQTEHTLIFKHSKDSEIKHELFPCKERYISQWSINRKECNSFTGAKLFLDSIKNLDTGIISYSVIVHGQSNKLFELLDGIFKKFV